MSYRTSDPTKVKVISSSLVPAPLVEPIVLPSLSNIVITHAPIALCVIFILDGLNPISQPVGPSRNA